MSPPGIIVAYLEYLALALATILALRLLTAPPLRRDAFAKPLTAAIGVALLVAAGAASWWLALRVPAIRHSAAAAVTLAMLALWWRARPSYGARRRWPPGSLGISRSLAAIDDRRFYLNQARRHGPVFKMSQFGRPVLCVVGFAKGRELLSAHADSLEGATLPYNRLVPKGSLRYMSQRDHSSEAPLFRSTFHLLAFGAAESMIRAACAAELARLANDSSRRGDGVRGREYFEQWLLAALARLFFGLSPADHRVAQLGRWVPDLAFGRVGGPLWRRRVERGLLAITEVMRSAAHDRGLPRGTALDLMLQTDSRLLDDATRTRNLILIFRIALGDLTGLLDWIFKFLGDSPTVRAEVRSSGRQFGESHAVPPVDLGTCVVMETLRLEQSEFLYRKVASRFSFDRFEIPAGWLLRICTQESHRDPSVFHEPDAFIPERFRDRVYSRSEYSPFGADVHGCMGARLAHFLGRIFVEELCIGFDWRVVQDGPLDRGSRHRHHWRPSARRRVVMTPWVSAALLAPQAAPMPPRGPQEARSTPA